MKNLKKHLNPIRDYYDLIANGSELVGDKVRAQYEYLVWLMYNGVEYIYDERKATKAISFVENFCKHSKGKWGGKPFILELWQKAFIAALFGFVHKDTGLRKFNRATLLVPRKNGKSALASAIALYMLFMDDEAGAEIYSVATKRDQAKIVWDEAKRMIAKSPYLRKYARSTVSKISFEDSTFSPLGRDSDTLDGLNVHCAIMDEIHAWKDQNLYDVIVDGTSARDNWLVLTISTAGTIRGSVYDKLYEEGKLHINNIKKHKQDDFTEIIGNLLFVPYELDNREDWKNPSMWKQANPSLGSIKGVKSLANMVNEALADTSSIKNLLTKQFNIPETSSQAWLSLEDIINEETFDITQLKPKYAVGGFDLSETTDLTCATMMFMVRGSDKIYQDQMYWIPSDTLEQREKEDKVPYSKWIDQGYLRTCEGNKINHKAIVEWFLEMQSKFNVYFFSIGYDRWSASYLVDEMRQAFGKQTMVDVAQGVKTLSAPMYQLGAEMKSKKLVYNRNPIFEWCCTNVMIAPDKNNNIQPIKIKQSRVRIDGFASSLDAYVALDQNREDYIGMIGG